MSRRTLKSVSNSGVSQMGHLIPFVRYLYVLASTSHNTRNSSTVIYGHFGWLYFLIIMTLFFILYFYNLSGKLKNIKFYNIIYRNIAFKYIRI